MTTFIPAMCALLGLMVAKSLPAQQGLNNIWMGGYGGVGPSFGPVDLRFSNGALEINSVSRDIWFFRTSANITNAAGELLFSTNGAFLANATGDTLLNGAGLNPSPYTSSYPEGLHIPQACLILPLPDSDNIYYIFHNTIDHQGPSYATRLYLTVVDMGLDGGLGAVTLKNHIVINDSLNSGKITAVRHANGRDWWVLCHRYATNSFYRLLVTPDGVQTPETQAIGVVRYSASGQVCFSPQGERFAYYRGTQGEDLDIFEFDRCSGLFSDPVHILIYDANSISGVAFSPNSRYLYVSSSDDVYQFDTEAPDIAASRVDIAEWDGFYSPEPPFATKFDIAQLAPDGKIYIGTGNSTFHLHVIHDPDSAGLACNIEQHGIELPHYYVNSLPNHPNYHLGPVDGSVCDSLGINTGVSDGEASPTLTAFPNPSSGHFTLSYPVQSLAGVLEVRDVTGRVVLSERVPPWSQVHRIELTEAAGLYHATMRWGNSRGSVTVLVE